MASRADDSGSEGPTLTELAHQAVALSKKQGAADVAVSAYESRSVGVTWRDGKLEELSDATTRGLALDLYVAGRYSSVSTSDLRPAALAPFIADAIALARVLTPDPDRRLPEPALYAGRSRQDLEIDDPGIGKLGPRERADAARTLEASARGVKGAEAFNSVTGYWGDTVAEEVRVTSNGFEGASRQTSFSASVSASAKDSDGRRPESYAFAGTRRRADLPELESIGEDAARRTLGRLGQQKGKSERLSIAIENRAAAGLLRMLVSAPLSGKSLQQKRSFLEGKLGQTIGSSLLDVRDEPLLARGLASRAYDGEGITTRPRALFERGVLRSYFIDTYYGRKLRVAPTTASTSNVVIAPGTSSPAALLAAMKDGVLVTGFLGGNNTNTGDYSLGIVGFRVRQGQVAEPIGEMNVSGNQLDLWKRLVAVGNDPFPYSSFRLPTLVFEDVQIAGV